MRRKEVPERTRNIETLTTNHICIQDEYSMNNDLNVSEYSLDNAKPITSRYRSTFNKHIAKKNFSEMSERSSNKSLEGVDKKREWSKFFKVDTNSYRQPS